MMAIRSLLVSLYHPTIARRNLFSYTSIAATSGTRARSFATKTTTTTQSHTISGRVLPTIHPLHLFRIVQDVDRYKEFLPFCGHSHVFQETIRDGGRFFEAELAVGFGPSSLLQTKYLSKVSVDPENLTIETKSGKSESTTSDSKNDNSMFESLNSKWKLRPVGSQSSCDQIGTSVDFSVEMTVTDPMVAAVLNQVLVNVAETQVQAFHDRCKALPRPTMDEIKRAERHYKTQSTEKD